MNLLNKIKNNLFIFSVIFAYTTIFILNPETGIDSVKGSGYYIKEMLMIMPVVFVLTALLDLWVPKEKIEQHLGDKSKTKGIALSFILGSVSAGPIYAAFPFCIMLLKKGASIKNIIIILSSWAVIKIPMLTIETKFLGPKFMISRYILTVLAIIIFSTISSKILKNVDITKKEEQEKVGLQLDTDACMGCALCAKDYPELFYMKHKKAYIHKNVNVIDMDLLESVIQSCPVKAIEFGLDHPPSE